jgi:hypothetical protein
MISHLFSCENATCAVPEAYREIFRGSEEILTSPEGWEPGSLNLAQGFAMKFRTPLVHGDVTRLLIDLEKDGEQRWSRFSLKLPEATRQKIVDRHERPYRTTLKQRIETDLKRGITVLHVRIHTHADPDGKVRVETRSDALDAATTATRWCEEMRKHEIDAGQAEISKTDALAKELTRTFPQPGYLQLRFSVSQTFFMDGRPLRWDTAKKIILDSLTRAALPG